MRKKKKILLVIYLEFVLEMELIIIVCRNLKEGKSEKFLWWVLEMRILNMFW